MLIAEVDVRSHSTPEPVDEVFVHELELIGDVETDDALARELVAKLLPEATEMSLLHHEDEVRPAEVPGRDADSRAVFGAGRANVVTSHAVENRFGRQTAESVATADE